MEPYTPPQGMSTNAPLYMILHFKGIGHAYHFIIQAHIVMVFSLQRWCQATFLIELSLAQPR